MARSNFEPIQELACPHDGWYNGNPKLMIANGTYDDYRFRLVEWVKKGKLEASALATFDAQWAQIPMEEKIRRRDSVVKSLEFVPKKNKDGTVEMVTTPSDNGAAKVKEPQFRKKMVHRQAPGALGSRVDPLRTQRTQAPMPQQPQMMPPAPQGRPVPPVAPGMIPPQAPSLQQQLSPAAQLA